MTKKSLPLLNAQLINLGPLYLFQKTIETIEIIINNLVIQIKQNVTFLATS